MIDTIQIVLAVLIALACTASVLYSVRYRRTPDGRLRGLYNARMNISMGLMLILMAIIQMFLFSGSTVRVIVGALFLLLGIFNLFAGLRNHAHFSKPS